MPLVKIENLTKTYYRGNQPVYALKNIGFQIEAGEFSAIIGKSGCGKSTLLNLLGGLDTATSGSIVYQNQNVMEFSRNQLAEYRKNTIGMVFQSFHLIPSRTALENVTLAMAFANVPKKQRRPIAAGLLEQVGLAHRLDHYPKELSGGEAQRVAIARALANGPEMLLADEPTGNLDSQTSREIGTLLNALNQTGVTILMVTHDDELASQIAGKTIYMRDGKIHTHQLKGTQT